MSMTPSSVKVAVLMGGPSGEHDISLKSGGGVVLALKAREFAVTPIEIPKAVTIPAACAFVNDALRQAQADVAFIALHGPFGEDGTIQQLCDELHVAYTGSDVVASRLGMDKIASRKRFEAAGLQVPQWQRLEYHPERSSYAIDGFAYPIVVKPACQGSSLGISIVQRAADLPAALRTAGQYGSQLVIEAFIRGRELTVGVLGDTALPVIEIRPRQGFFDFTAKYTPGMTEYLVPAPLDPAVAKRVQEVGHAAHRALGCRHLSRADILLTSDNLPVILEVNTIPGFTPTSLLPKAAACVGISYDDLCERLVMMALTDASRAETMRHASGLSVGSSSPHPGNPACQSGGEWGQQSSRSEKQMEPHPSGWGDS